MSIRNVVTLFIALVSAGSALARDQILKPEQTRPWVDNRYIVGLVPNEDGLDVFWVQNNELVSPLRTRLLRTTLTADGLIRGPAILVLEQEGSSSHVIHGEGASPLALWTDQERLMVVSPIVNDAPEFPDGKFLASFVNHSRLVCGGSRCVASWQTGKQEERMAVILDRAGNATSAPFFLPHGWLPMSLTMDEGGIFYVRQTLGELRSARIGFDGVTLYDVNIAATIPASTNPTPVAAAFDGSRHIVTFVARTAEPEEVRAVAISETGTVSAPVTLVQADAPVDLESLAIAWNGESFLLAGGYVNAVGTPFVRRFDAGLQALDPFPVPAGVAVGSPQIQVIGSSFAIGWNWLLSGRKPRVTIVSPDGEISPPIDLEAVPRRRGVVRP